MGKGKKKSKKQRGNPLDKTNAAKYEATRYSTHNKSPRQRGVEKRIILAFKTAESQKMIRTDDDSTYLRAVLHVSREITQYVTTELNQPKLSDPKFWSGKILDTYFERRYDQFMKGEIQHSTIARELHALEAFRTAANETNVYGGEKINIGNYQDRRENFKSIGAVVEKTEITAVKVDLATAQKVHQHIDTSTPNGKATQDINRLQSILGGRISATLRLTARDIKLNDSKNSVTAKFIKDKNKFTRTVPVNNLSKNDYQFVKNLVGNKTGGQKLFNMKDSNGNTMSDKRARQIVQEHTKKAAVKAGVYKDGQRFNTHSNRKGFAQATYDRTKYYSKARIYREISQYLDLQGSNREQIRGRLKNELKRINKYRTEHGKSKRSFSHEEARILHVSLLLGHSRMNVVKKNYIVTDKEKAKIASKTA